jgi:CheY-like chemotaxis protein
MDGFQLCAELSHHPDWQNIPVVIVTAKDLSAQDELLLNGSALLSGCVKRILQKGEYSRDDLIREIRELVGSAAQGLSAAPASG